MYKAKVFLVNIRNIQKRFVALLARGDALKFVHLFKDFRTTLLKQLSVTVVVFKGDAVLLHDVVVHELRGRVHGKAATIGHSKTLRHFMLQ